MNKIILGDCIENLKELPENSVDSIVTDPPYGLGFMGKKWDALPPGKEVFIECLRVLKPGGHLLSFGGTRTYHRMAVAIEDAGFEIRDMIEWLYGSGFPKSHNIGKSVDKLQGNEREEYIDEDFIKRNPKDNSDGVFESGLKDGIDGARRTKGTSEYEGWGTALKPAHEPICMARKPLSEKTVAKNCLKWGTGGINIDESRVGTSDKLQVLHNETGEKDLMGNMKGKDATGRKIEFVDSGLGRFPANLIHDNSDEVRECFPTPHGAGKKRGANEVNHGDNSSMFGINGHESNGMRFGDQGNASRFFKSIIYTAKASKSERNKGCEELEIKQTTGGGGGIGDYKDDVNSMSGKYGSEKAPSKNNHPTVKPIALMEYLIKMVTPKGGTVLDPFMGSGSTGVAAKKNGYDFIGIELQPEYIEIAKARIENC